MKKYLFLILGLSFLISLIIWLSPPALWSSVNKQLASVFFVDSVTTSDLQERYLRDEKIRILIVPGHDQVSFGTSYGEVKEVDLNLLLGAYLVKEFEANDKFEVILAQTAEGYKPEISQYIVDRKYDIWSFRGAKKAIMDEFVKNGLLTREDGISHISASNDTVLKLYGLNHWANEHKIDLILHLHFNDYPGRRQDLVYKYRGFSIYLPEQQYSNAKASWALGEFLKTSLSTKYQTSNHFLELDTLMPSQDLIAIGASNTVDGAVALIEYGYIYEPHLAPAPFEVRNKELAKMAKLTYQGVENYLTD